LRRRIENFTRIYPENFEREPGAKQQGKYQKKRSKKDKTLPRKREKFLDIIVEGTFLFVVVSLWRCC